MKVSEVIRNVVGTYPYTDAELSDDKFAKTLDMDFREYAALRDALPLAQAMERVVEALSAHEDKYNNIGTSGYGKDRERFYCEDCKQSDLDYTKIQHTSGCFAAKLLEALREYEALHSPTPERAP